MDVFELINKVKALTAAVKAGNLAAILDLVGDLSKAAAGVLDGIGAVPALAIGPDAEYAELDAAVGELDAAYAVPAAAVGEEPARAIDVSTILTVISLVKTLAELFKSRRG